MLEKALIFLYHRPLRSNYDRYRDSVLEKTRIGEEFPASRRQDDTLYDEKEASAPRARHTTRVGAMKRLLSTIDIRLVAIPKIDLRKEADPYFC